MFPGQRGAWTASTLSIVFVIVFGGACWSLDDGYAGIAHDAGLYALQTLSHIDPLSLGQDVFLKFGSQDRFTLFSPLFAAAAKLIGIEPAAALLTLVFQAALVASVCALARRVMPLPTALLGIGVFMAVPGDYGVAGVFTCMEGFLTPRMAAEALVIGSVAAALGGRRVWAGALIVLATALHPIMAMAGLVALFYFYVGLARPVLTAAILIVGIKALVLLAFAMPTGEWGRFDGAWLTLVETRSPYLFLAHWQLDDWARVAVTLATLALGIIATPHSRGRALSRERALCIIALATVLSGFVLTVIACDVLHLVLFTQLQAWRCQWLGAVVAAVMLPRIVCLLWQREMPGRSAALLLGAAWVFASNEYALVAAGTALSAVFMTRLKPNECRWILWGSCGMLAMAIVWRLASNLEFTTAHYLDSRLPPWSRRVMGFSRDGTAAVAFMALAAWAYCSTWGRPALILLIGLAGALCLALLPYTWASWTRRDMSASQYVRFSVFRDLIPPGADVFWPESPVSAWMLLHRPSYLSILQTSGMVFSRTSAKELDRRAHALGSVVAPRVFLNWSAGGGPGLVLSDQQLERSCALGEFGYLVTTADLQVKPLAMLPAASGAPSTRIRLYRCGRAPA